MLSHEKKSAQHLTAPSCRKHASERIAIIEDRLELVLGWRKDKRRESKRRDENGKE